MSRKNSTKKNKCRPHLRSTFVFFFIIALLSYTSYKLVNIKLTSAQASTNSEITEEYYGLRGNIYDRNGVALSTTIQKFRLILDTKKIKGSDEKFTNILTTNIDLSDKEYNNLLSVVKAKKLRYYVVKRDLSKNEMKSMEKTPIPGIWVESYSKRVQSNDELAGPVVGFVNDNDEGVSGVESALNDKLKGKKGITISSKAGSGMNIPSSEKIIQKASDGEDIHLSIDRSLQYKTSQTLLNQVQEYGASGGVAIVADVRSGEILALADVNGAKGGESASFAKQTDLSKATSLVYEPGSTHKAITVAAALEKETVTPDTKFTVPYRLVFQEHEIEDSEEHATAEMSVSEIVRDSSNVGTIKISFTLDKPDLYEKQKKFGLGKRTGVELPAEEEGIVKEVSEYNETSRPTISIGNGIAVTPMQMLSTYMTIANGGVKVTPTLIKGKKTETERVLSVKVADELKVMLEDVVLNGTGESAKIEGYKVAGKTGTARKYPYFKPPYTYIASFAGFAPADDPRYAVLVVIDAPKGAYYGGVVAAPVFASVLQDTLITNNIMPTGNE